MGFYFDSSDGLIEIETDFDGLHFEVRVGDAQFDDSVGVVALDGLSVDG